MKILNLYAGLGGNRKHWDGHDITAVESDPRLADQYQQFYPHDTVIIEDAHQYLLDHADGFDFIWSSPPCQSHTRMIRSGKNRKPRYPDLRLYEEILFLMTDYEGSWVVENVKPYYTPLVAPARELGRHMFWSNLDLSPVQDVPSPPNFINTTTVAGANLLKDWLGLQYDGNIYYGNNHCPGQVLRNCVHPDIGQQVLGCV